MFKDNSDYYPTPKSLIYKMLLGIDFKFIQSVLEPSAGKGDLVETILDKFKYAFGGYNRKEKYDIDCIETDENLQYILKGKGYRVIYNDFLEFQTYKKYDLIIMNPPFSDGDKHLLKALEMQEVSGGRIVCLLNAETLKNAYSNSRKDLIQRLDKHNASIEYIKNAFVESERSTNVEIALITINIEKAEQSSVILDNLKKQESHKTETVYNSQSIISADFIKGIIEQYNYEVRAGLKLIEEYEALKPLMLNKFEKDNYTNTVLKLELNRKDEDHNCSMVNSYVKQIRMKYWEALFTSEQFIGMFTSNLRQKYLEKVNELRDYDFSLYNIYTIRVQLNKELVQGIEDTILELFTEFSGRHSMDFSKNIHYYNGWRTNKCYIVSKRVVLPLNAYSWSGTLTYGYGNFNEKLSDIEKVFSFLDANNEGKDINLQKALKLATEKGITDKIETKYFKFTTYKKGTTHIEFTNLDILQKFNLFGSQHLGWLPPSYGKKTYKDMTPEEKTVIDEYEGVESYNKVLANKDYYIVETSKLLMLA